jgi:NADPH:quinone reductase-like Zn-dependent oxidoreductase
MTSTPATTTMRGWAIGAYGETMRLMELPAPRPGPSDLLLRMHGAEIGDWDDLVRRGEWPMARPFPLVLGLAGAGTIAAVGTMVRDFAIDDPAYAYSYPLYDNGAWAEYMLVPQRYAAPPPQALDLTRSGAVPIAGLTAHECVLDILKVEKGQSMLITAAAGGVGHIAVQIAAHAGAHVVASAGPANLDFVTSLGAEMVIDYTSQDLADAVLGRYPGGVDKALNGVPGEAANEILAAVRAGGTVVDLPGAITAVRRGVRVISDYVVKGDGARLRALSRMIDDGRVRAEIGQVFPFERAPDALEMVLGKHLRGKVALKIG